MSIDSNTKKNTDSVEDIMVGKLAYAIVHIAKEMYKNEQNSSINKIENDAKK